MSKPNTVSIVPIGGSEGPSSVASHSHEFSRSAHRQAVGSGTPSVYTKPPGDRNSNDSEVSAPQAPSPCCIFHLRSAGRSASGVRRHRQGSSRDVARRRRWATRVGGGNRPGGRRSAGSDFISICEQMPDRLRDGSSSDADWRDQLPGKGPRQRGESLLLTARSCSKLGVMATSLAVSTRDDATHTRDPGHLVATMPTFRLAPPLTYTLADSATDERTTLVFLPSLRHRARSLTFRLSHAAHHPSAASTRGDVSLLAKVATRWRDGWRW